MSEGPYKIDSRPNDADYVVGNSARIRCSNLTAREVMVFANDAYAAGRASLYIEVEELSAEVADLREKGEKYDLLCRALSTDAACLPACDSHAHEPECPTANTAAQMMLKQAEIERLRAEVERLRGATPATPKASRPEWVQVPDGFAFGDYKVVHTLDGFMVLKPGGGDARRFSNVFAAQRAAEAAYDREQGGGASKMPTPPEPEYLPATGFTTRGG